MMMELPRPVSAYFRADLGDGVSVSECFAEDAVVIDEGNIYSGRDAIRDWKTDASSRYTYAVEPFALGKADGRTVVTAHLTGDFPGSPVDLRYFFVCKGDRIGSLEIKP